MSDEPIITAKELADALDGRSATYALLARLYRQEVDEALLDELHGSLFPADALDPDLDAGYLDVATYLSNLWSGSLHELKVDFARCFLGHGVDGYSAAYPVESVYTSEKRLTMEDARDEVLAVYRTWGMERSDEWKEGEDHLALELEFERALGDRAAEALRAGDEARARELLAAQLDFLEEHIAAWAPMMTADMRRYAQTRFYQGLARLTDGFLRTDLEFLRDLLADGDASA